MKEDDECDRSYYDFKPYRVELYGPHELRIFLTDSEIQQKLEEEKTEDDEENS